MNDKTLKLLEYDIIRKSVADHSLSEEAAKIILEENPYTDIDEVIKQKSQTASIIDRMIFLGGEQRESLPHISNLLPKLSIEGYILEIDEVYAIGIFIRRAEVFRQWLMKSYTSPSDFPLINESAASLPPCNNIAGEIFKILDNEGKLRDLPELRAIRRRIQSIKKDIEIAANRYLKSEDTRHMLQSELPSQRDGRMVLAMKANFRGRIKGIVHEISSSGQTIFVEPQEAVEKNNELLLENRRLDAEIRRVIRELTGRISSGLDDLIIFHKGIIELEIIRAKAHFCNDRKYVFAGDSPHGRDLILKQARHPLLGRKAVPINIKMETGKKTVIITGPNTGGKTVALKTLGLLAMMNQSGLALPVEEGTILPIFDGIFADIGDEQSISQSLSTFYSHTTNIADVISKTTENSLVLLDELGSGTDPEEGSAIAMAILDYFIELKTRLLVSTHHGILKNYGYTREGVENASMEFDSETLSPTFNLVMGVPGESRALDIAVKNGFPQNIVNSARSYLDEERADVSALISGLKNKHRELDLAVKAGKIEEEKLLEERRLADLKELRLKQKELHLRSESAAGLRKLLGESRKTLENLVRELKEGELNREKTMKVKLFHSDLEELVRKEEALLEMQERELAEENKKLDDELRSDRAGGTGNANNSGRAIKSSRIIEPGVSVLAGKSKRPGRIVRLDKKNQGDGRAWIVEIGSLKMSFPENEIILLDSDEGNKESGKRASASWDADLAPREQVFFELNLLGMRLPDALEALRKQIDAALMGGLGEFAVVHGKGDGILSNGVQKYLKNDPKVASFAFSRPESGGFGRTEVILKR